MTNYKLKTWLEYYQVKISTNISMPKQSKKLPSRGLQHAGDVYTWSCTSLNALPAISSIISNPQSFAYYVFSSSAPCNTCSPSLSQWKAILFQLQNGVHFLLCAPSLPGCVSLLYKSRQSPQFCIPICPEWLLFPYITLSCAPVLIPCIPRARHLIIMQYLQRETRKKGLRNKAQTAEAK